MLWWWRYRGGRLKRLNRLKFLGRNRTERVSGKPDFADPGKELRNRKRVGLARRRIVGDCKVRLDNLGKEVGCILESP